MTQRHLLSTTPTAIECDLDEQITIVHPDGRANTGLHEKLGGMDSTTLTVNRVKRAKTVLMAHCEITMMALPPGSCAGLL